MTEYRLSEIGDGDTARLWLQPSARDRYLQERLAELENFIAEDRDWIQLGASGTDQEISRQGLLTIGRIARLGYLQNPVINRGITVKANYVWGRGCNISAKDATINEVIQQFLDDLRNQVEFTSQPARIQKEIELQTDGNIFFAFIIHPLTGRVRIRSVPVEEITDMITNPDDRKEVRFYRREWNEITTDLNTGEAKATHRQAYYPDWTYRPRNGLPTRIGDVEVINVPVYHVKVGGFSDWKFGAPEILSALFWAKAYTKYLTNWSSLMSAYARFAFKITASGGKTGIDKAKEKLASTITRNNAAERNPAPAAASNFVRGQNDGVAQADIDVVRTAGATTSAEDGRRLLLMVCAAFGVPETFLGDVSVGTLATAKSLDRPTELGFINRQALWGYVYHAVLDFVLYCSAKAPNGIIANARIANIVENEYGEPVIEWQDDINSHIDVDFPPIVEHGLQEYISAVKSAATFDGATPSILNDNRLLARMVLTALGENDVGEIVDRLYPLDADGNPLVQTPSEPLVDELAQLAQGVTDAVEALRESIDVLTSHSSTTTRGNGVSHA